MRKCSTRVCRVFLGSASRDETQLRRGMLRYVVMELHPLCLKKVAVQHDFQMGSVVTNSDWCTRIVPW
jgi:hypothetical protein